MHNILYENQQKLTRSDLKRYASQVSLDTVKFSACLESGAHKQLIYDEIKTGDQKGLEATPTFFLNGKKIDNWPQLSTFTQAELDKLK